MEKPTLDKIEALAGRGLTEQQIADALGIDIENCAVIKQRSRPTARQFAGESKGIADLSNALFNKAKKGDTRAMIFLLEHLKPKA